MDRAEIFKNICAKIKTKVMEAHNPGYSNGLLDAWGIVMNVWEEAQEEEIEKLKKEE